MNDLKLVVDAKAIVGEGPCWDDRKNLLYWVDIEGKKLHCYNPIENINISFEINQYIGTIGLCESEKLIVALHNGIYFYDTVNKSLQLIVEPNGETKINRFNDGKCDPYGDFWAGTMPIAEDKPVGKLYRLGSDLKIKTMVDNVTVSNGLAFNPEEKLIYYIDSPTKEIVEFKYDEKLKEIINKRVAIKFSENEGVPDGMTIDSEGSLWIAQWGGAKVTKRNPKNGKLLDEIKVPANQVSACTFGGDKLDELYITTARRGLNEELLELYPNAGGLFKIKLDVKGLKSYRFKG